MRQELTETHYGKNDYIFREGDPTVYFHNSEGRDREVRDLRAGGEGIHAEDVDAGGSILLRRGGVR